VLKGARFDPPGRRPAARGTLVAVTVVAALFAAAAINWRAADRTEASEETPADVAAALRVTRTAQSVADPLPTRVANRAEVVQLAAAGNTSDTRSPGPSGAREPERAGANLATRLQLGPEDDVVPTRSATDRFGNRHTRYRQTHRGIPIWGHQVVVHADRSERAAWITGQVVRGLADAGLRLSEAADSAPERSEAEALRMVQAERDHLSDGWTTRNATVERVIFIDPDGSPREVYAVNYLAENPELPPTRPYVLVDAATGESVREWESLAFAAAVGPGGNQKTGRIEYGVDRPPLDVTAAGVLCSLENAGVETINLNHGDEGEVPFPFTCPENTFK